MLDALVQFFKRLFSLIKPQISDDVLIDIVKTRRLNHIVIIPDGDRRWARERGLNPTDGHKFAIQIIPSLFEEIWRLGIHTATLSLFSTENFGRKQSEVEAILAYINTCILNMLPIAKKVHAKMIHLGRKDRIPDYLLQTIQRVERETISLNKHIFNFAIDYGSRDEICRACNKIWAQNIHVVDEKMISNSLDTAAQPHSCPDFVIRTGKVNRLSGFMAWQATYSELLFPQKYFPDFNKKELRKAIFEFGKRTRRFGAQ